MVSSPAMLSALLFAPSLLSGTAPGLAPVVRSLGALVPAAVEGLVRDVILLARRGDEGLRSIAEHAGCRLVEADAFRAGLKEGLGLAKQRTLFALRAGTAFDRGFLDELAGLLGPDPADDGPAFLLRQVPDGFAARLLPDLAPVAGLIAPRDRLSGEAADFAGLVRAAGRTRTLASRAVVTA